MYPKTTTTPLNHTQLKPVQALDATRGSGSWVLSIIWAVFGRSVEHVFKWPLCRNHSRRVMKNCLAKSYAVELSKLGRSCAGGATQKELCKGTAWEETEKRGRGDGKELRDVSWGWGRLQTYFYSLLIDIFCLFLFSLYKFILRFLIFFCCLFVIIGIVFPYLGSFSRINLQITRVLTKPCRATLRVSYSESLAREQMGGAGSSRAGARM